MVDSIAQSDIIAGEEPLFRLAWSNTIMQRPTKKQMGFAVCEVRDGVDAQEVVNLLNLAEDLQPIYRAVTATIERLGMHGTTADCVESLAADKEQLDLIADMVGEADDVGAAWESVSLIISEHRAMRAALVNADNLLLTVHGPGVEAFSHELNRLLADISELPEPRL